MTNFVITSHDAAAGEFLQSQLRELEFSTMLDNGFTTRPGRFVDCPVILVAMLPGRDNKRRTEQVCAWAATHRNSVATVEVNTTPGLDVEGEKQRRRILNTILRQTWIQSHGRLPKLLLVDDDGDFRREWKQVLGEHMYDFREERDSGKALMTASSTEPDIIILDWLMLPASGDQIAQEIRQTPKLSRVPILIVSGYRTEAEGRGSYSVVNSYGKTDVLPFFSKGEGTTILLARLLKLLLA